MLKTQETQEQGLEVGGADGDGGAGVGGAYGDEPGDGEHGAGGGVGVGVDPSGHLYWYKVDHASCGELVGCTVQKYFENLTSNLYHHGAVSLKKSSLG